MLENADQLAKLIDHTLLRPDATVDEIAGACDLAKRYGFASLMVNSCHVKRAHDMLMDTPVKVGSVVGFPFGACTTTVKIFEAMEAMKNGAEELDMVVNIGMVKSGNFDFVEIDMKNIMALTPKKTHKIIVETGFLTAGEITRVCEIAMGAGAAFVKTSTGYGPRGATLEDVKLMRSVVGTACHVKAAGGIRTYEQAMAMINAGANRIGTSTGPAIVEAFDRVPVSQVSERDD